MLLTEAQKSQVVRIRNSFEVEIGKRARRSKITPKIDKLILSTQSELADFWLKRKKEIYREILGDRVKNLDFVKKPNVYSSLKKQDDFEDDGEDEEIDITEKDSKASKIAAILGIVGFGIYKIMQGHGRDAYKIGKDAGRQSRGLDPTGLDATDRARIADEMAVQQGYIDALVRAMSGDFGGLFSKTYDNLNDLVDEIDRTLSQADRGIMTGAWATSQRALGGGMEEGSDFPGGYWHIEDDDACDGSGPRGSGCKDNEGVYFTWDEFFSEYGSNDCYNNCRCMEHFEPAPFPTDEEVELMMKADLLRGRDIATAELEKRALLLGKFPATNPTTFKYKESMEAAGGIPGLRPTAIVVGNDDQLYVWKEVNPSEAGSEVLAARLAAELMLPSVDYKKIEWKGKTGVITPFVADTQQLRLTSINKVVNKGQIVQALVFDAWIANTDRADRNILVNKDNLAFLIDHGFSLAKRIGMTIKYRFVEKSKQLGGLPISWENIEPMLSKIENLPDGKIKALVDFADYDKDISQQVALDLIKRRDSLRQFFMSWMNGERSEVYKLLKDYEPAGPGFVPGPHAISDQRLDVQVHVPVREDLAKPSEWRRRKLKNKLPYLTQKNLCAVSGYGGTMMDVEINGLKPRNWLCSKVDGKIILGHGTHMLLWQAYGEGKFEDYCRGRFKDGGIQPLDKIDPLIIDVFRNWAPGIKIEEPILAGVRSKA